MPVAQIGRDASRLLIKPGDLDLLVLVVRYKAVGSVNSVRTRACGVGDNQFSAFFNPIA
jgi:hypothetical protein